MTVRVWRGRHWLAGAAALVTVLGPIGVLAPAGALTKPTTAQENRPDRTSAAEARQVDSVPTPKLVWENCEVGCQCMRVHLPLD